MERNRREYCKSEDIYEREKKENTTEVHTEIHTHMSYAKCWYARLKKGREKKVAINGRDGDGKKTMTEIDTEEK